MRKYYAIFATLVVIAAVFIIAHRAGEVKDVEIDIAPKNRDAGQKENQQAGTPTGVTEPDGAENKNTGTTPPDPESLLESLKKAMAEGDWQKSKVICEQLAKAGPRAFRLLSEILKNNESMEGKDVELRWRAAYILGLMADKKIIPVFDDALKSEKAENVRNMIVLGFGKLQDDAAAPILERLLLDEKEGETARRSSAAYLAQLETGIRQLIDIIQNSESAKDSRLWAIEALPCARNAGQYSPILNEILNSDPDMKARTAAAKVMGEIADPDSVNALTATLKEDSEMRVRVACAGALGYFKNNESVYNSLIDAMQNDKDATVREYAAKALGSLENKHAAANFEETLRTERNSSVRMSIAESLGKIGGEKSRALLENLLKNDPSVHVRRAADEALKSLHN
ncbi:MAG: HEAT repeat domain-containing protein [Planctomycetota bacterium]|nr:MAG: HEAT repeat domain-containing protein [Planctomycetota bacterium]